MSSQDTVPEYSLQNLFETNLFLGFTCVAYRLPKQQNAFFRSGNLLRVQNNIPKEATFLFSGFEAENGIYALAEKYFQESTQFHDSATSSLKLPTSKKILPESMSENHYKQIVHNAVHEIENGKLEKVVLSRPYKIFLTEAFKAIELFIKLTEKYPDAFVYLLISPELGNWIGATPELLLQTENNTLKTIALAGTRHISQADKTPSTEEIFLDKEKHEQNVVTDYIEQKLKPFTENINISQAHVKKAGNLFHLQTKFSASLKDDVEDLKFRIIEVLHPTPAVGGIPLQTAKEFISTNENYDRALYTGFLGPVDENTDLQLFVNLRCMQFTQTEAVLYAGAGIVKGSDPQKEWQETQQKMRTLLDVMDAL